MNDEFSKNQKSHIELMTKTIKALQANKPLVLKGGTALMLGYGLDRFSEDLDFDIRSDFHGQKNASLSKLLKDLKGDSFEILDVTVRKDTNTVNRYRMDYLDNKNERNSLKIEISYRTPIAKDRVVTRNGLQLAPIEDIASFKVNSVIDKDNDSRTKARDLYDANFILKNYPEAITDLQLKSLSEMSLDDLEERYKLAFEEDLILNHTKDLGSIIIEISENAKENLHHRQISKNNEYQIAQPGRTYTGNVLSVDEDVTIQKTKSGKLVVHQTENLPGIKENDTGSSFQIRYGADGKANITNTIDDKQLFMGNLNEQILDNSRDDFSL